MRESYAKDYKDIDFSGGSRGGALGAGPRLFLDQTEARSAEKRFLTTVPSPYLRIWMTWALP